jgi:hypothetical protein
MIALGSAVRTMLRLKSKLLPTVRLLGELTSCRVLSAALKQSEGD